MVLPKDGSRWTDTDRGLYHVLHTVELEGHTWVHYIKETKKATTEIREYSCYLESFLARFTPLPD